MDQPTRPILTHSYTEGSSARTDDTQTVELESAHPRSNRRLQDLFSRARQHTTRYLNLPSQGLSTTSFRTPRFLNQERDWGTRDDAFQRHHHRRWSVGGSVYGGTTTPQTPRTPGSSQHHPFGERNFYDDFTTIDWAKDTVRESARKKQMQELRGFRGRVVRMVDAVQGWLLIAITGFMFALLAYVIAFFEGFLTDLKHGYCTTNWINRRSQCCDSKEFGSCGAWRSWSNVFDHKELPVLNFVAYFTLTVAFAMIAVFLTLQTRSVNPLTENEQLGKSKRRRRQSIAAEEQTLLEKRKLDKRVIYTAYGSGVPEVKTILSGFVIRRFLGTFTLIYKSVALVFSVSSGMSLGKEGPFVHLATCIGNITCRLSQKFSENDMKRRQLLAAAASSGVALAFGSPLGGVLFALEEISYYFLPQQLFRMFFCAMISTLFLKFMDPYGTGKTVLFEISYPKDDWNSWELILFVFLGICGGLFGGIFCKFYKFWGATFRKTRLIQDHPALEVLLVAVTTAILTFPNKFAFNSSTELLYDLAKPCSSPGEELCPSMAEEYPPLLASLCYALLTKIFLTAITFGIKVPAGVYIPSMAIGALFGRMTALTVQYIDHNYPMWPISLGVYLVPGVYAMAGAGAFMAGVTRMNVTLAVILFELTGSLEYVLPFSITILVANWVANALEPGSIYDTIISKNNYPFLDNRKTKCYDSSLADLVTVAHRNELIDVSKSVYIHSRKLRAIMALLQARGEYDGCIPLVKGSVLVGMITAPELEFALDRIAEKCEEIEFDERNVVCKVSFKGADLDKFHHYYSAASTRPQSRDEEEQDQQPPLDYFSPGFKSTESDETDSSAINVSEEEQAASQPGELQEVADLTQFVDRAPVTMDLHSPLALVQMMFQKLGVRAICVTRGGKFLGVLHRKKFIDFSHTRS